MTGPGLSTRAGVLSGGLVDDALEVVDRDRRRALPRDAQEPSGVGNDREALFGDLLDADPEVLGQCPLDRPELVHVETGQEREVVPVRHPSSRSHGNTLEGVGGVQVNGRRTFRAQQLRRVHRPRSDPVLGSPLSRGPPRDTMQT